MPTSLTRREALKGAAALAALGATATFAAPARGAGSRGSGRDRVAIVGGGAGGVSAAYFLDATFDVDLFEARDRIGGHCDSRVIDYDGQPVTVDVGAQFFHPKTHPLYVTLLEEVGLHDRANPQRGTTRASPGSLCVFPVDGGPPKFTSTKPLDTVPNALGFLLFTQLARNAILRGLSWDVTVDQWIRRQPLDARFKRQVLYPWITATIGCSRAEAAQASARSILQTFALAFPSNPLQGASTYNSTIGLQGNLQRLLDRAPRTRVHLGAPALGLARREDGWMLQTPSGLRGPFEHVVLNAPPRATRELLRPSPALHDVTALLDQYDYFDSRLVIHRDPVYAYQRRARWTAYNAGVDGVECEGSAWIGALHEKLPSGATVDVFKSWAQRRQVEPADVLIERRFRHPLINQRALAAARGLRPLQGRDGLHFCGTYTTGTDLQETAVYSALKVAEAIAPASPTVVSLQARMRANGIAGISYDLGSTG